MAFIIGIASNKGGSGKTTVATNFGQALAARGKRVLFIDGDGQQSLTNLFRHTNRSKFGLTQMITSGSAENCITNTNNAIIDLVINDDPAGEAGGAISSFLRRSANNHAFLSIACESVQDDYDYIIIDTHGSIGTFQESVVYASDLILTPVKPNYVDVTELVSGVLPRFSDLLPIRSDMHTVSGKDFPPVTILLNQFEKNLTDQANAVHYLRTEFLESAQAKFERLRIRLLDTVIYKRAVFNRAQGSGVSAESIDKTGSPTAKEMMDGLINDLIPGFAENFELLDIAI